MGAGLRFSPAVSLPMSPEQLEIFRQHTGRTTHQPPTLTRRGWLSADVAVKKSLQMALLQRTSPPSVITGNISLTASARYYCGHSGGPKASPNIMRYVRAFLTQIPIFRKQFRKRPPKFRPQRARDHRSDDSELTLHPWLYLCRGAVLTRLPSGARTRRRRPLTMRDP